MRIKRWASGWERIGARKREGSAGSKDCVVRYNEDEVSMSSGAHDDSTVCAHKLADRSALYAETPFICRGRNALALCA